MAHLLRTRGTWTALSFVVVAAVLALGGDVARAQTISNLSIAKNGANSADELTATGNLKEQTVSTVAIQASDTASFSTRYAFMVGNDRDGGLQILGNTATQSLNANYTISFQVTAPGAYRLHVGTALSTAITRVDDGSGSAGGDFGAVGGAQSGGSVTSGSLGLASAASVSNGSGNANVPISQSGAAVITGVSNGSPVNHSLTFSFSASCRTIAAIFGSSGEECGIRGGISSGITGYTAGIYPGSPARVAADDGHFVTVSLESLCENGVVDAPEEDCDLTGQNGDPDVCCASTCRFKSDDTLCRGAEDVCDVDELCTGADALCPADAVEPDTTVCRASGGICDVVEYCDGTTKGCAADAIEPASTVCRPAAGDCDVDDFCPGDGKDCTADDREPPTTLCRDLAGTCATCNDGDAGEANCDLQEYCDGGIDCPADLTKEDSDFDGLCNEFDNCPDTTDPTFVDDDGDGVGNSCDACTNVGPVDVTRTIVTISKIHTPESDDVFKFDGRLVVPASPPIDPAANGLRFRFEDPDGNTVIDELVPAGAYNAATRSGWKVKPNNWKYTNNGLIEPLTNGITSVVLTQSRTAPGSLKFSIKAKKGFYPIFPEELPLKVSLVVDAPIAETGQCGEVVLSSASCKFDAGFTKVKCK